MKAAVVYQRGDAPQYTDEFPQPVPAGENEVLISVKAAAVKHLDRSKASGTHYFVKGERSLAKVPGVDGVSILPDGTRVYAPGLTGMMAEKAVVDKSRIILLPAALDDATAAALPNAVAGSAMALRFRAGMSGGETVLINGATGVTGKTAVQIAKYYGAGKVIATGRNEQALDSLKELGADEVILTTHDEAFISRLQSIHQNTPFDIVIDYLWGHTAELILQVLKGNGELTNRMRFVSVGSLTGEAIRLSSEILRSIDLQLSGSGLGSWSRGEMQQLFTEIIPEMFRLSVDKKLVIDTASLRIEDIGTIWNAKLASGTRLVVVL